MISNTRDLSGVGFIIIPSKVNRDDYVNTCYRTSTVCLLTEDGEFISNVKIDEWLLQLIDFPENSESLGSEVVYVNLKNYNKPIGIAKLSKNNELVVISENQFKLLKTGLSGIVSIIGDADKGNINISILSTEENRGDLNINVIGKNNSGKVNLSVKGNINVVAEGNIDIESTEEIKCRVYDLNENKESKIILTNDGKFEISPEEKVILKNSSENFKDTMEDFLDSLVQAVIQTPSGPGSFAPDTITKLNDIKNQLLNLFE